MKIHGSPTAVALYLVIGAMSCVDNSLPITSPRNANENAAGHPAKPPDGCTRIVFSSDRGSSSFNIYVMKAGGGEVTPLTAGIPPESYSRPDWSPLGRRLVCAAVLAGHLEKGGQIYVMSEDGTGRKRLSTPGNSEAPRWSPDGRTIAFCMRSGEKYQVYVMSDNGAHLRRLTIGEDCAYDPAWSPDGRTILYTSGTDRQIHSVDLNGRHDRILTRDPRCAENPAWSPKGDRIAFTSFRDNPPDVWENSEIYVMNADGGGCKRLTNNPAIDAQPAWIDDGSKIAFVSKRDGNSEIYIMNADGAGQRRITDTPTSDTDPVWAR